jgi:dTDP-glucose pyrophosphorylase
VDTVTEGAAVSCLLAKNFIDNDDPLVIANADQFLEWNSNEFMYAMTGPETDGGIATFPSTHPRWSYCALDDNGWVCQIAEKKPISNIATSGICIHNNITYVTLLTLDRCLEKGVQLCEVRTTNDQQEPTS